jgi:micrococcal nuclease
MQDDLWTYRAVVLRVVDGDTFDARIDLGFHTFREERLRLVGVDAPEMRGATRDAGIAAREALACLLTDTPPGANTLAHATIGAGGAHVVVRTVRDKTEKYGRTLARVLSAKGVDVGESLVQAGHATVYPRH